MTQVALPIPGPLEAVPGLWPTNGQTGMLCVCNVDVFEAALEPGQIVGELHAAVLSSTKASRNRLKKVALPKLPKSFEPKKYATKSCEQQNM